jgi:hypothetical protein
MHCGSGKRWPERNTPFGVLLAHPLIRYSSLLVEHYDEGLVGGAPCDDPSSSMTVGTGWELGRCVGGTFTSRLLFAISFTSFFCFFSFGLVCRELSCEGRKSMARFLRSRSMFMFWRGRLPCSVTCDSLVQSHVRSCVFKGCDFALRPCIIIIIVHANGRPPAPPLVVVRRELDHEFLLPSPLAA